MMRTEDQAGLTRNDCAKATINVRLPKDLKTGCEQVLEREGVSVSDLVRRLCVYLDQKQAIPEFLKEENTGAGKDLIAKKRDTLKNLVGAHQLSDLTLDQIRGSRLDRQLRSGVQ